MINSIIIADSISLNNERITSFILTIPQIIVKELLRHRMFSFSSSSMRAIPFNKVIQDIRKNMFVPIAFQSHHVGMQGTEYLINSEFEIAKEAWIKSGLKACEEAERLYNLGVTKQICSRMIEPFGYARILVTATEWENFFQLRCPKYIWEEPSGNPHIYRSKKDALKDIQWRGYDITDLLKYTDIDWQKINHSQAEIHIQALAESMWDAYNESTPKQLKAGEWHIPDFSLIK